MEAQVQQPRSTSVNAEQGLGLGILLTSVVLGSWGAIELTKAKFSGRDPVTVERRTTYSPPPNHMLDGLKAPNAFKLGR